MRGFGYFDDHIPWFRNFYSDLKSCPSRLRMTKRCPLPNQNSVPYNPAYLLSVARSVKGTNLSLNWRRRDPGVGEILTSSIWRRVMHWWALWLHLTLSRIWSSTINFNFKLLRWILVLNVLYSSLISFVFGFTLVPEPVLLENIFQNSLEIEQNSPQNSPPK